METETDNTISTILETFPTEEPTSAEEPAGGELVPVEEKIITGEIIPVIDGDLQTVGTERDVEFDYEYSRNTHKDLIEKGNEALDGILEVAKESQHPRAYEVAGTILKNLSDMTDKLMVLQEKKKALKKTTNADTQTPITVEKAVFVGSTSDLLKKVRQENSK